MEKNELLRLMKISKNTTLYYECSEELKKDFNFITEVIKIYKDNFNFIDEVAESYVKHIPEEDIESNPYYIELCMLLGQYVPKEHQYYEFYTNRLDGIYKMFLLHVMMTKDQFPDVSELGFSILVEDYGEHTNILDYFAKRLMNELYHMNNCGTFEDLVHKHCESAANIMSEGYVDFFARNLYGVDQSLSYYVFDHAYLLDELIDELDEICENWDIYEELLTGRCVSIITEWVSLKEMEKAYGDDFDYTQAMNEVIVSMNFSNMFKLNKKEVLSKRSKVLSFGSNIFKNDLKNLVKKVLFERMTITELDRLLLEDEEPAMVLGLYNE